MSNDYVLGNDQEELARLKLQHNLWKDELIRLWDFSILKQSAKVLELGCGPGFTTMDLISYIKKAKHLTAVDISDSFLEFLKLNITKEKTNLEVNVQKSFIENLSLTAQDFDVAFCRWLMIFVQKPEVAVQKVHSHLRASGQFVIQEYISYDDMDLVPNYPSMRIIVDAIFKSWKDQGGDPNRGKYLPQILERNGFKVVHLEPRAKFAKPDEPLWAWPDSFYKIFLPKLVKQNYLSQNQVDSFMQDWNFAKNDAGSFFVAPTVINIIAEKKL